VVVFILFIGLIVAIIYHLIEYIKLKEISSHESIERIKISQKWNIAIRIVLTVLILLMFFLAGRASWDLDITHEIDDVDKLNFQTVTEVFPQKEHSDNINLRSQGLMFARSNFIVPTAHHFMQSEAISDRQWGIAYLYQVHYYEFRNEWLAVLYERELRRSIGQHRAANVIIKEIVDRIEIYVHGFDSAIYYSYFYCMSWPNDGKCDCDIRSSSENLILRSGSTIIIVSYEGPESLLDSVNKGRLSGSFEPE
jgi:hypothetical protein